MSHPFSFSLIIPHLLTIRTSSSSSQFFSHRLPNLESAHLYSPYFLHKNINSLLQLVYQTYIHTIITFTGFNRQYFDQKGKEDRRIRKGIIIIIIVILESAKKRKRNHQAEAVLSLSIHPLLPSNQDIKPEVKGVFFIWSLTLTRCSSSFDPCESAPKHSVILSSNNRHHIVSCPSQEYLKIIIVI